MIFQERLKALRKQRGLTQEQLAIALNIPSATIRRLETVDSLPRMDRLDDIANFFNVSTDYLLGRTSLDEHRENDSNFGYRMKNAREKLEISQEELGDMLNLSQSSIAYYENNKKQPSHSTLIKLSGLLGVSIDYLLGRVNDPEFSTTNINELNDTQTSAPDFATAKDKRDFKKFLEQQEIMFDGVPMTDEDKARVLGYMEGMFWEAKQMNKRKKPKGTEGD